MHTAQATHDQRLPNATTEVIFAAAPSPAHRSRHGEMMRDPKGASIVAAIRMLDQILERNAAPLAQATLSAARRRRLWRGFAGEAV